MAKLASKNQPEAKRNEASVAVTIYFKMADTGKAIQKQERIGPRLQQGSPTSRRVAGHCGA